MTREILTSEHHAIHPWADRLLDLPEGKGSFYHWGPNYTVDPIVLAARDTPSILLVKRRDTGIWALPGGFVDTGESTVEAGIRELGEETNLSYTLSEPQEIYRGPVDDPRSTKHAWPETTALLWRTDDEPVVAAGDDAADACWVPLGELPTELYGSHRQLIDQAISTHGSLAEQLAYFAHETTVSPAPGGHMAYQRVIAQLPTGKTVFCKHHEAARFTDPTREHHSRLYLQKELETYRQLSGVYRHSAQEAELVGDHTLLLEAYEQKHGWHWRAPNEPVLRHRYITDVLTALSDLPHVPYERNEAVTHSYQSFIEEGWGAYPELREQIISTVCSSNLPRSYELSLHLDALYQAFLSCNLPSPTGLTHYDLRQSNLAWHPEHGVRIVDWSWADTGPEHMDSTSFLIDLAKSGIDITPYQEQFDTTHALVLIGFWLGHSTWPTPTTDRTVRMHQLASAIAAFRLITLPACLPASDIK